MKKHLLLIIKAFKQREKKSNLQNYEIHIFVSVLALYSGTSKYYAVTKRACEYKNRTHCTKRDNDSD